MMKWISISCLLILLASCQKKSDETTALLVKRSDGLIASSEPRNILISQIETPLTKEDQKRLDRHYPGTLEKVYRNQRLQLQDIINLTRSGVEDRVIIEIIETSQSQFFLTPENERELDQAGVSKRVILVMRDTADSDY